MKILLILLFTVNSFAQEFKLSPSGFVNPATEKDYVVLEFPNKTKEELYAATLKELYGVFKSPKTVLSELDNETITINAIASEKIRRTSFHKYENQYAISLAFKEGKIKVSAPVVHLTTYNPKGELQQLHVAAQGFTMTGLNMGVYKKDGNVKYPKAVADLEGFANNYVTFFKNIFKEGGDNW